MSNNSYMGTVNSYVDTNTSSEDYDDDYDDPVSYVVSVADDPHIKGNFIEVNEIGSGNFGFVYQVTCKQDKKKYALKYVWIKTPNNLEKREVEVLKSLDHRNVMKYYNDWSVVLPTSTSSNKEESNEKHIAYLVMQIELCQGGNLGDRIKSGEVFQKENENKRHKWILDIIAGMIYIHNNSIIHRDLKPDNILIGMDDLAKIGDFGLARAYKTSYPDGYSTTSKSEKDEDLLSRGVGTRPYVAPEVLTSASYSKKADYYSLGVILAELHHDMGQDRPRIMNKILSKDHQDFTDLKVIPQVLEIIKSLLNRQPEMRMELEAVLDKLLPLKDQQSVENLKVGATRGSFCETEHPGHSSRKLNPKIQSPTEPYAASSTEEDPEDPPQLGDIDRALTLYE